MKLTKYLLLFLILLVSLAFRVYIIYFIPISQSISFLVIICGLVNLILIFNIIQRSINVNVGLLTALMYAISPWVAYLEVSANSNIILLTCLLVLYTIFQILNVGKKLRLIVIFLTIVIYLNKFNQITIFSDVGLLNAVNSFRGENNQTVFAPLGKIIENRYIYFSEHLIFNILKQFTPATYFTNQTRLLEFSFTPPIFLGFIIPFLFGLLKLAKSIPKRGVLESLTGISLFLPSILSKDSPDLSRLVLVSPFIFFIISSGLYELILNYRKKAFYFLLLLTFFMVTSQFFITITDIAIREPVRLQQFLGQN